MAKTHEILVIGAGIFGMTAALELRTRGHDVALLDPGPIPHPLASSTDISKMIRIDYGMDEEYMMLSIDALDGWHKWAAELGGDFFHERGITFLTHQPMRKGMFEFESRRKLRKHGYQFGVLDQEKIRAQLPAWNSDNYIDGYYSPVGGYAESSKVIVALAEKAKSEGVIFYEGETVSELCITDDRIVGIKTESGEEFNAGQVVIAAGAWSPALIPDIDEQFFQVVGMPVFHLKPDDPALFSPPNFFTFTAGIEMSGWYGFPYHPTEKVVKIGWHGLGEVIDPKTDDLVVTNKEISELRRFLKRSLPALRKAEIVHTRRCLYCDTFDGHFLIDQHPEIEGLFISTGGSGHAFKFGPLLGGLIADRMEGIRNPYLGRFGWRRIPMNPRNEESARYMGGM